MFCEERGDKIRRKEEGGRREEEGGSRNKDVSEIQSNKRQVDFQQACDIKKHKLFPCAGLKPMHQNPYNSGSKPDFHRQKKADLSSERRLRDHRREREREKGDQSGGVTGR